MRPAVPEGYKAKFIHRRQLKRLRPGRFDENHVIDPRGGETVAKIYDADGNFVTSAVATCHERDNYNKKIGRDIALGRALKRIRP